MGELRRSAAYRIAFATAAAFALTILLLGAAVYLIAHTEFRRQQDAGIADESADLVRVARMGGPRRLADTIASREAGGPTNVYGYALFDAAGLRVAGALETSRPARGWQTIAFIDPREGEDTAYGLATALPGGWTLVVARDGETLERVDRTILMLFGGSLVVVLLLSAVGALVLGAYLRRRLERIGDTARAILAGDLASRAPVGSRGDEFDRLAISLNLMLDRIAALMDNLRQVSGDVAHDLRTPLARLRAGLEAALDRPDNAERQRAALSEALARSDEVLSLFAAILRISEVEAGPLRAGFEPFDAGALIAELCESFAPAVADGGRDLRCSVSGPLTVRGDRPLITQALVNLLDNAQRHTPAGTRIGLRADGGDEEVALTVADHGPGVPREDRKRITRRFVRLDRSRSSAGHGLGLALVEAVAGLHGGTVEIGDNDPGLRVTLRLPATLA